MGLHIDTTSIYVPAIHVMDILVSIYKVHTREAKKVLTL